MRGGKRRGAGGFTLVEVLAALLFMAIVIPVAVQGLSIASRTGEVATRKGAAARLADRLLNEAIVTGQTSGLSQGGIEEEGGISYRWQMQNESWQLDAIKTISVVVKFTAQGQEYDVRLSTLIDTTIQQP